jgi:hypothetical protein
MSNKKYVFITRSLLTILLVFALPFSVQAKNHKQTPESDNVLLQSEFDSSQKFLGYNPSVGWNFFPID